MATTPEVPPEEQSDGGRYVVFGLVALVLAGMLLWSLSAVPAVLSRIWSDDLSELPEDVASTRVGMLAQLGDAALPALVEALGHPRESVAAAARDTLRDELARWRLLPAEESTPKIALLVECLNERVARWRPEQRRVAAELAQAALVWQCAGEQVDRTLLVARCETILRAAALPGAERVVARAVVEEDAFGENPRLAWQVDERTPGERIRGVAYEELASLPGGDLPFDIAQIPALSAAGAPAGPDAGDLRAPGSGAAEPLAANEPPRLLRPRAARPLRPAQDAVAVEPDSPAEPAPSVPPDWSSAASPRSDEARPNSALRLRARPEPEEIAWMRQLTAADPLVAERARKELLARGFDATALELGVRLVHPDPAVRRALCDELPRVPRLDARAWLLWLADDPEPSVRTAARGVLATSPDAELVRRADEPPLR